MFLGLKFDDFTASYKLKLNIAPDTKYTIKQEAHDSYFVFG